MIDYREEGKKVLGTFTAHDLDVFEKGAKFGDSTHDENHKMPQEWYDKRDQHRKEVSPKVEAFYNQVKDYIESGRMMAQNEFKDFVENHTLEVLIKQLTDSTNEEAGALLQMLVDARKKDESIRKMKSAY